MILQVYATRKVAHLEVQHRFAWCQGKPSTPPISYSVPHLTEHPQDLTVREREWLSRFGKVKRKALKSKGVKAHLWSMYGQTCMQHHIITTRQVSDRGKQPGIPMRPDFFVADCRQQPTSKSHNIICGTPLANDLQAWDLHCGTHASPSALMYSQWSSMGQCWYAKLSSPLDHELTGAGSPSWSAVKTSR